MYSNCYARVLLDSNGLFSPERFVENFLNQVERENIPYCGQSRQGDLLHEASSEGAPMYLSDDGLPVESFDSRRASNASSTPSSFYDSNEYRNLPNDSLDNSLFFSPTNSNTSTHPPLTTRPNQLTSSMSEQSSNVISQTASFSLNSMDSNADMLSGLEDLSDEDEDYDNENAPNQNLVTEGEIPSEHFKNNVSSDPPTLYPFDPHHIPHTIVSPNIFGGAPKSLALQVLGPECLENTSHPALSSRRGYLEDSHMSGLPPSQEKHGEEPPLASFSRHQEAEAAVQYKLKLVLDLDNTLLHACALSKLCNVNIPLEEFESPENDPELYAFRLSNFSNQQYHVKFRPGVRQFLSELSKYCDLGIHTNATHEYADVIVSILDPDYSLFQGRVASRDGEAFRDQKKHVGRLFRVDDLDTSSLIILDDRKDVWDAMYHPNIIKCGMYDYLDSRKAALIEKYRDRDKIIPHQSDMVVLKNQNSKCLGGSSAQNSNSSDTLAVSTGISHDSSLVEKKSDVRDGTSCDKEKKSEYQCGNVLPESSESEWRTVVDETLSPDVKDENFDMRPNDSDEVAEEDVMGDTTPFLDNPLVKQSQPGVRRSFDEAENFEDDDVITVLHKPQTPSDTGHMTFDWDTYGNADVKVGGNKEDAVNEREDAVLCSRNAEIATHFGVDEDAVTENMRLAMQLCSTDQALVDFDTQLDELRQLIIDVAIEYNRKKANASSADTVSVAQILAERRQSILKGIVVQTVGMYKSETSHPEFGWQDNGPVHRRRLVRLGAQVVDLPVPELTHIVAMRATQTIDRVRRERGGEVHYVHALWLHACESTWSRVPEKWFTAFSLLQKYDNTPPLKPWVDHWQLSALQKPVQNVRLVSAIQYAAEKKANQNALNSSPLNGPRVLDRHVHTVLSPQSAGAEIWSAKKCIALSYDPLESAKLKTRFDLPLTPEESHVLMCYNQQKVLSLSKTVSTTHDGRGPQQGHGASGVSTRSAFRYSDVSHLHRGWEKKKRHRFGSREHFNQHKVPKHLPSYHRYWIHDHPNHAMKKHFVQGEASFYKNGVLCHSPRNLGGVKGTESQTELAGGLAPSTAYARMGRNGNHVTPSPLRMPFLDRPQEHSETVNTAHDSYVALLPHRGVASVQQDSPSELYRGGGGPEHHVAYSPSMINPPSTDSSSYCRSTPTCLET